MSDSPLAGLSKIRKEYTFSGNIIIYTVNGRVLSLRFAEFEVKVTS